MSIAEGAVQPRHEEVHFVGIGGSGMSGLARILAADGVTVTGSDAKESDTLADLRREFAINASAPHDASHVIKATLVVASAAISADNVELRAAELAHIPVITRAEMLGRLMDRYAKSVAISGTHGKTTTTGMAATVFQAAGLDPTVVIGGTLPALGSNARLGKSDIFIAEACEAYGSFLELRPAVALITNVEPDHLDFYGSAEAVDQSFRSFIDRVTRIVILNADDPGTAKITPVDRQDLTVVTYGIDAHADVKAMNLEFDGGSARFDIVFGGLMLGSVHLSVPGRHNVSNALGVIALGLTFGINLAQMADALKTFCGTGRRFEHLGSAPNGAQVIDDYAHHPTEIRATLAAARQSYGSNRIVAVFQPHLPSRTQDFMQEFASSFGDADLVVLTDIYLARENARPGLTGETLFDKTRSVLGTESVKYVGQITDVASTVFNMTHDGDVVVCMGAGEDIRAIGEQLVSGSFRSDK